MKSNRHEIKAHGPSHASAQALLAPSLMISLSSSFAMVLEEL